MHGGKYTANVHCYDIIPFFLGGGVYTYVYEVLGYETAMIPLTGPCGRTPLYIILILPM